LVKGYHPNGRHTDFDWRLAIGGKGKRATGTQAHHNNREVDTIGY